MISIVGTLATSALEQDHRMILQVITRMANAADELDHGKQIEPAILQEFLEFFRVFVKQAHHKKEELILFVALEKKGVPANGCPLATLRSDHVKSQVFLRDLADCASAYLKTGGAAASALARALRHIAAFYAGHIWTENYVLLPMANKCLSSDEQDALCEEFTRVDSETSRDFYPHFEKMAEELGREVSI